MRIDSYRREPDRTQHFPSSSDAARRSHTDQRRPQAAVTERGGPGLCSRAAGTLSGTDPCPSSRAPTPPVPPSRCRRCGTRGRSSSRPGPARLGPARCANPA
ncbi:unnamed protein product [Coccothraustes coccothraustes]